MFRWSIGCIGLLAGLVLMTATATRNAPVKKRYQIEENSKLYLEGTSNVNSFTCDCSDRFYAQYLDVESKSGYARFQHAEMALKTAGFDCHNRKIDHDMQKALKADQYPQIRVNLLDARHDAAKSEAHPEDWFEVQAKVNLTITGCTKEQLIKAKAKRLGPNRFRLLGEKAIQMSHFGIDPPEALFGMIKVNDLIIFKFDLTIRIDDGI